MRASQVSILQITFDVIALAISLVTSYTLRFLVIPNAESNLGSLYFKLSCAHLLITLWFLYSNSELKIGARVPLKKQIPNALGSNLLALVASVVLVYFFSNYKVSRGFLLIYFGLSCFSLTLSRFLHFLIRENKFLTNRIKIVLIGNNPNAYKKVSQMLRYNHTELDIIGWLEPPENKIKSIPTLQHSTFLQLHHEQAIDSIYISFLESESTKQNSYIKMLYNELTPVHVLLPTGKTSLPQRVAADSSDYVTLALNHINHPYNRLLTKRIFDILFSSLALIILSPLLLAVALIIKLTSRGPALYFQDRVGLDGTVFTMWKFRTMTIAKKDEDITEWSTKDLARKTQIGRFLRKSGLDELPQLWNILRGDMSLIGPRPERPFFVNKFKQEIPGYMLRHKMSAGLSGWAQIHGYRGDTCIRSRVEYDIYYIKNWSLWLDIEIFFLTIWKGLFGKNAY